MFVWFCGVSVTFAERELLARLSFVICDCVLLLVVWFCRSDLEWPSGRCCFYAIYLAHAKTCSNYVFDW